MSNQLLQTAGESLSNIGAAIAEIVRQDAQGGAPPVQHFQQCLDAECQRLSALGEDGLAGSLQALGGPLARLMTQGW